VVRSHYRPPFNLLKTLNILPIARLYGIIICFLCPNGAQIKPMFSYIAMAVFVIEQKFVQMAPQTGTLLQLKSAGECIPNRHPAALPQLAF